ncbi:MAG TPA: hypothetical protein VF629_25705 [Hymenobacter sp.]|jgi:hypothetical protein|uniref:hypothetical protein n=1 Tax=Hymenobacter sp. TaxID=1898978 RepID=UPI002EDB64FD
MSDLLLDINLQNLPDDYFMGEWHVASRVLNRNDASTPLAQANRVVLTPNTVETHVSGSSEHPTGSWAVVRDELMNRPYLRFDLPEEDTRALVTRLRRSLDGLRSQLNLYFASGMEIQLDRF